MKTRPALLFAAILIHSLARADVTLDWRLDSPGEDGTASPQTQTWRIAGRWIRIDRNDSDKWLLLDSGYLLMHVIDPKHKTFSVFGRSPIHEREGLPATHKGGALHLNHRAPKAPGHPPGRLRGTKRLRHVIGKTCREVEELRDARHVATHCMADARQLGLSERELISAARVIKFAKRLTDPDWVAGQSAERFLSIDSRSTHKPARRFTLTGIRYDSLPTRVFRIPRAFRKLEPQARYPGLLTATPSRAVAAPASKDAPPASTERKSLKRTETGRPADGIIPTAAKASPTT